MRINWSAVAQAVIVALLLGVGTTAWKTYQEATQIPSLQAEIASLRKTIEDLKMRGEANDIRQTDQINDMKITLAVLESRSASEAARHGKSYAPAVMEGR